jgi:aldehyde dehydrogenase (NAD+)
MEKEEIIRIRELQREFYRTGWTRNTGYRVSALKTLHASIISHEDEILEALTKDLGKSDSEGYMSEVGMVCEELSYMIRNTRRFAGEKTVRTPITQFAAHSFRKPSPRGTVLIMSPWNYPFLLTMDPLIDALAAGNTAMVKPSAYSPATSAVIKMIIEECFPERYVAVVTGGRAENTYLLDEQFDFIFFTGSKTVGRLVMSKASEHLTPVALELGGKSPCIVDRTANIRLAARRIVWGKFLNCGQTCVAPDYILCDSSVEEELIEALSAEIQRQYGTEPLRNPDYGRIINEKHFDRISGLIDESKVAWGGKRMAETLQIEPTVMRDVTWDDAVMKEEIFGPVLPVLTFDRAYEVVDTVNSHAAPLALYVFTSSRKNARFFIDECTFGGGCINDTVIHLASTKLGFGGVGESGMGQYHGKTGFDTFSHTKSIVDKYTFIDLPLRYQPYKKAYMAVVRALMR